MHHSFEKKKKFRRLLLQPFCRDRRFTANINSSRIQSCYFCSKWTSNRLRPLPKHEKYKKKNGLVCALCVLLNELLVCLGPGRNLRKRLLLGNCYRGPLFCEYFPAPTIGLSIARTVWSIRHIRRSQLAFSTCNNQPNRTWICVFVLSPKQYYVECSLFNSQTTIAVAERRAKLSCQGEFRLLKRIEQSTRCD